MDKLMNAAGAVSAERRECKFTLANKGTWRLTHELLNGMLEPIGFGGHELELLTERDDYLRSGEVSKSLIKFVMKHAGSLHDKFSVIDFVEYYTVNDGEHTTRAIIDLDNKHTKLSEIGDYTDTVMDIGSREDHDIFMINNGYALVTKNKAKQYKEDWSALDRTIEVVIIKIDSNPYEGLTVIPKESTLLSNVTYKDVTIKRDIIFSDEYMHELKISGNVVINSETPLLCSGGIVRIKGTPESKLTLIAGPQQPCIGSKTHTGMSYGRWSPSGSVPKEIVVDGVEVFCQSKVESFSIGCYGGSNEIPKITLLNGAELNCPEMTGKRVVIKEAKAPGGSTKISEDMVYGIMREETNIIDVVPAEVKTLYLDFISKYPKYEGALSLTTTSEDIREVFTILAMNQNVDVTPLLKSNAELYIKRCALLLRMPDFEEVVKLDEFRFDAMKKHKFINKLAYNGEEVDQKEAAVNLINYLKSRTKNTSVWNYIKEVCYEIIPAYLYEYLEHRGYTNEEHVEAFLEENKHLINDKYKGVINHDVIDYFLWNKDIV